MAEVDSTQDAKYSRAVTLALHSPEIGDRPARATLFSELTATLLTLPADALELLLCGAKCLEKHIQKP